VFEKAFCRRQDTVTITSTIAEISLAGRHEPSPNSFASMRRPSEADGAIANQAQVDRRK
jgi:hypothetical protein